MKEIDWKDTKDFKQNVLKAVKQTSEEAIDEALDELNILLSNPQDCGTPFEVVEAIYERIEEISINTMNLSTLDQYYGDI